MGGGPFFSNHNCHLFLPLSPNTHHHFFPFLFLSFSFPFSPFLSFTSPLSILPLLFSFFHVFNGGQYANSTPKDKGSVLDKHPVLIFIGCRERCLHFKSFLVVFVLRAVGGIAEFLGHGEVGGVRSKVERDVLEFV